MKEKMKLNQILNFKDNRKKQLGLVVILTAVLVSLGLLGNRHILAVATMVFVYIGLGQSWNLLSGFTGLFSISHAMFYGLGIYSVISGIKLGLNVAEAILVGILLNMILGAIVALVSRKLTGVFFTMSMIAMQQILNSIVLVTFKITGGANGIALPGKYVLPRQTTYWVLLGLALIMTLAVYLIRKSRMGTHFVAIRENPNLADSLGCNVFAWQFLAIQISAIMASIVGSAYAFYAISTSNAIFAGAISLKIIIVVMVGGLGTLWGPWCGSFIIIVDEMVRALMPSKFSPFSVIFYAIILIIIAIYKPTGIISFFGIKETSPAFSKMINSALALKHEEVKE